MRERAESSFNPKQLTSARVAEGLTMKELAERSGISRQMISNYESGKTVPKGENLLKIISVLRYPIQFFSSNSNELIVGATFFRSQSAATKRKRSMQSERIKFSIATYKVFSKYINFPKVNLPEIVDKEIDEISSDDIQKKAEELRSVWGIDSTSPVKHLINKAEVNGVVIVESNMEDHTLDAVSHLYQGRPFILLADNHESAVRRRFNIAHELGHMILHNCVEDLDNYSSRILKNKIERQANLFASYFLMPDEAFRDSLLSTSMDFYIRLKSYWLVSIAAMVQKTSLLELINDDQKLYLNKQISRNKWRKIEPLDNEIPIEHPTLFKEIYKMIIDNNVISKNDFFSELPLPISELESMLNTKLIEKNSYDVNEKPHLRLLK